MSEQFGVQNEILIKKSYAKSDPNLLAIIRIVGDSDYSDQYSFDDNLQLSFFKNLQRDERARWHLSLNEEVGISDDQEDVDEDQNM